MRGPTRWCLEPLRAPPVKNQHCRFLLESATVQGWQASGKISSFQKANPARGHDRRGRHSGQDSTPLCHSQNVQTTGGMGREARLRTGSSGCKQSKEPLQNLWVHGSVRHWRSTTPWVTAAQRPHRPGVKSLRHCRQDSGVPASEEVNALAKLT